MNFIKFTVMAAFSGLTLLACSSAEQKQPNTKTAGDRPNIIFIMSDDHAYQAISAYGSTLIDTPNIDRLAKHGIKFTNATVANSICAPSRATILTGKHSHLNGKVDNILPFDDTQTTFPQIFQQAGYQTAMFGKLHFGNNPKGVDDFMILPGQGNYLNPDFHTPDGLVRKEGYVTDIITDETINWIDKKRDKSKPFMMAYMHKAPHRPWWPRADIWPQFYGKTYPLPDNLFDDFATRGTAAKTAEMSLLNDMRYAHDSKIKPETYAEMGNVLPDIPPSSWGFSHPYTDRVNDEQKKLYEPILKKINDDFKTNWPSMTDREKTIWKYQRYMQDYLGTIASVDDNIGRLLEYLETHDLLENTLIVYTSDNGFYLGEHGWFDKRFAYEESLKVPLIMHWPKVIKAEQTSDELVQNLDYAQTFLAAAGITAPSDMQGENLMPLLSGKVEKLDRDALYYHYYAYPAIHMVKRHYAIITKKYKLIHFYHDVDEWEMYDRINDPSEMNNLYGNPEYASTQQALTERLATLRVKYKDSQRLDQAFIEKTGKPGKPIWD